MPIDDRLRTGTHRLAADVEPDVEGRLDAVAGGARPRPGPRAAMLVAYAAVIVLAVIVVPIGLRLMIGAPTVGSNPSAQPSTSRACGPLPVGIPGGSGGTCLGSVDPGAHRSSSFIPSFDYTIPATTPVAWDNPQDLPGAFALHPAGSRAWNGIFLFRDVAALQQQCDVSQDPGVGNSAQELADWMEANPGLVTTNRRPWSAGGLSGVVLDLAVSGTYTTVCPDMSPNDAYPAGMPLVPLFEGTGSADVIWWIGGAEQIRLYLLDAPAGGNVVIGVDAIDTDFLTLIEVSDPVVQSIYFDMGSY